MKVLEDFIINQMQLEMPRDKAIQIVQERPEECKQALLKMFNELGVTMDDVVDLLPTDEYKQMAKGLTLDQVLDATMSGFNPRVIK